MTTSRGTAYFNRITALSVWYALTYAIRGWRIAYFDQTRAGRAMTQALGKLLGRRFAAARVEYQLGDYRGLYTQVVRIALEITERWFKDAHDESARRWFERTGQPRRVEAYVKKATLLRVRAIVLKLMIVEKLSGGQPREARLILDGSRTTRRWVREYQRLTGSTISLSFGPFISTRLDLLATLVRYYAGLLVFILRRGVSTGGTRDKYLVANPAKWPMRGRRGGDFLVDGETILPSDVLLYYNSRSVHPVTAQSVEVARRSGYRVVVWDRVRVRLGWLLRSETMIKYLVGPLRQTSRCLLPGEAELRCEIAKLMLRLRRRTMGWDVFFERYEVGTLIDGSFVEDQAAAAMSIHDHGGIAVGLEMSENTDPFNELNYFLAHHCIFTWGQGVADLWRDHWYADEVVTAGYIWGHLHQQSLNDRDDLRARFGVTGNAPLIAVFDSSVSGDSFHTPSALQRFYGAVTRLAGSLDGATVLVKPKSVDRPMAELGPERNGASGLRLIWADPLQNDTNEVIAAADLVVNMGQSSTVVEALVCGVPALVLDETGRDWERTLGRPAALVFDDADGLCAAASRILEGGIEARTWAQIQERIKWNFGAADGSAIARVRERIREGRRSLKAAEAEGQLAAV